MNKKYNNISTKILNIYNFEKQFNKEYNFFFENPEFILENKELEKYDKNFLLYSFLGVIDKKISLIDKFLYLKFDKKDLNDVLYYCIIKNINKDIIIKLIKIGATYIPLQLFNNNEIIYLFRNKKIYYPKFNYNNIYNYNKNSFKKIRKNIYKIIEIFNINIMILLNKIFYKDVSTYIYNLL